MTTLVLDTSPLSHFARADRLAQLCELTNPFDCLAPEQVMSELDAGIVDYPSIAAATSLEWVDVVKLEELPVVLAFARYKGEFGGGPDRNNGEAAVLAWCSVEGGIAVVDDAVAVRAARRDGIDAHGTLWLIVNGYRGGLLTRAEAERMVDELGDTDMRLPTDGAGLFSWAQREGLL